jgi:hypothetical protein
VGTKGGARKSIMSEWEHVKVKGSRMSRCSPREQEWSSQSGQRWLCVLSLESAWPYEGPGTLLEWYKYRDEAGKSLEGLSGIWTEPNFPVALLG